MYKYKLQFLYTKNLDVRSMPMERLKQSKRAVLPASFGKITNECTRA